MWRARRPGRTRVTLIGDIGGRETLHVGDEAMFAADLDLARRLIRGARCLAVSADPAATSAWYRVDAVPRLSSAELRALRRSWSDGAPALRSAALDAAREADVLWITGGGNLNAGFPEMIEERLAMARATAAAGGTIVVSGQTIGPALAPGDAERVGELLDLASFIGVRDPTSCDVARALGVDPSKIVEQVDDAVTLEGTIPIGTGIDVDHPYIAVTVHPHPSTVAPSAIAAIGDELAQVAQHSGAPVVVLPHCRDREGPGGTNDEDVGAALAARLQSLDCVAYSLPVLSPSEVIGLTRASALVISSRYHPLVFATAACVPALGLWSDAYVRAKQHGALAVVGTDEWLLPLELALRGGLASAATELWDRRAEIGAWLVGANPWLVERVLRRDRVLAERLGHVDVAVRAPDPSPVEAAVGSAPVPQGRWHTFVGAPDAPPVPDPLLSELRAARAHARALEAERDDLRSQVERTTTASAHRVRRGRATVVLDRLRLEVDAGRVTLVGRVSSPDLEATGESMDVRMRVYSPDLVDAVDASATPFVPALTLISARLGNDLVIEAPVDPTALENAARAGELLADWWAWRPPAIVAPPTSTHRAPSGTGLWFSRGVDSMYTLRRALGGDLVVDGRGVEVTHLLGLDWIDPPFAVSSLPQVWSETADAAASLDLPLLRFTTDIRKALDPLVPWPYSHGAVFAGLGSLLGGLLATALLSSSELGHDPRPYGSHPALDPLWSTGSTRLVHIGAEQGRCEKIAALADDDWALERLKTCYEVDTARNCGRCVKCLLVMTGLDIAGALDRCDRFDAELSPGAVRRAARHVDTDFRCEVADVLGHLPAGELRAAWSEYQERLTEALGSPTGAPSG